MKQILNNTIFLFLNYFKIINEIKKLSVNNIKIFHFKNWHHGYCYFTGHINDKKIFIKVDTQLHLLENEVLFYKIFNDEMSDYLVPLINYSVDKQIQIVLFEFVYGEELSESVLSKNKYLLNEIYTLLMMINKKGIIHRDIKLDNFLFVNNKIKIIDFTFVNSIRQNYKFKELNLNNKYHVMILKLLGRPLKPAIFEWNDFYSITKVIKSILINQQNELDYETKEYFLKYSEKFNLHVFENSYKLTPILREENITC